MKEVIVFGVGAVAGGVAATVLQKQVSKEIAELVGTVRWLVERFHQLVTRAEAVIQKLEAKL